MMNLFLIYQFLKRLAKPFKDWEAYKLGIIDERGNILKSRKDLKTKKERNAFGLYDLMVLNLKKLIEKLPGGKTQIASYAAALYLLREWNHFTDDTMLNESVSDREILESMEKFKSILYSFPLDRSNYTINRRVVNQKMHENETNLNKMFQEKFIPEEAPTNSAGSGAIAGIGVGPDGEPGLTRAQRIRYISKNIQKKKKEKKNAKIQ